MQCISKLLSMIDKAAGLFEIVTDTDSLRKIVNGGNVVVAYMTDWCGPCIRNVHEFFYDRERIRREIGKRNLRLAYVDPDFVAPVHDVSAVPVYFAHGSNGDIVGFNVGKIGPNGFIEFLERCYGHLTAQP